ncbi:hypothetical protein EDD18DRAFT_1361728 [Armillaria luteobubalina]|uniref:Uncharacterized protein n=1 Tax=Armillaria luteobubalina TaxID=153913 RepID=A0AA39ULW4_9AGAR|nr:hypothetical protein EDD18DRAFT_1361728 [Armillaria luteobubalina]
MVVTATRFHPVPVVATSSKLEVSRGYCLWLRGQLQLQGMRQIEGDFGTRHFTPRRLRVHAQVIGPDLFNDSEYGMCGGFTGGMRMRGWTNLECNVPGSNLNCSMSVVDAAEIIKGTSLTDDGHLKAAVLSRAPSCLLPRLGRHVKFIDYVLRSPPPGTGSPEQIPISNRFMLDAVM